MIHALLLEPRKPPEDIILFDLSDIVARFGGRELSMVHVAGAPPSRKRVQLWMLGDLDEADEENLAGSAMLRGRRLPGPDTPLFVGPMIACGKNFTDVDDDTRQRLLDMTEIIGQLRDILDVVNLIDSLPQS